MDVRVAIAVGDPAGIGPEIVIKALSRQPPACRCRVFAPPGLLVTAARRLRLEVPAESALVEVGGAVAAPDQMSDAVAGAVQIASLEAALEAVLSGRADALCTAPITKVVAHRAGFAFPGHTEYLAHRTGAADHAMMLAGPSLRVVPLTGHIPLAEVSRRLTVQRVRRGVVVTARALAEDFGIERPRLAIAALNPHAGEGGMLGREEEQVIAPALERAREELLRGGIAAEVRGPLAADGLFVPPVPYDAVICAYHDQAMIPIKVLERDRAVNVTLGLPIVRTSPAHGSARDLAGRGVARAESMVAAIELAVQLVRRRRGALARQPLPAVD